jgi:hypothetical protein
MKKSPTTKKPVKKRVGRPPGRKAPHRPVVSARVPLELYERIRLEAQANGRTMGEELVQRASEIYEWRQEKEAILANARQEAAELLGNAHRSARKVIEGRLNQELESEGYLRVVGWNGAAWFEPGVDHIQWIDANSSRSEVLEQLIERAAERAVERAAERALWKRGGGGNVGS